MAVLPRYLAAVCQSRACRNRRKPEREAQEARAGHAGSLQTAKAEARLCPYLLRLAPGMRTPPLPSRQAPARSTPRRVWVGAGSGPRLPDSGQEPAHGAEEARRYQARGPAACGAGRKCGRVVERTVKFPVRGD